jgi:dimethylamine/trimethylamine dehydrogenase
MGNVSMYTNSELDAEAALSFGADHIAVATGARWTKRLYSALEIPAAPLDLPQILTPEDVFAGTVSADRVLVFDYDNYYFGWRYRRAFGRARQGRELCHPCGTCLRLDLHDQ